jgi:hypothetical protein
MPGGMTAILTLLTCARTLAACGETREDTALSDAELRSATWEEIVESARGTTVYWMHWRGDPAINRYTDEYVARRTSRSTVRVRRS